MNRNFVYNILMKWTTDEKQFLKRHYNDMSTEDIASKLGRNPSNIASQIYYLRKRGWTFNSRSDIRVRKETPPHASTKVHRDRTKYRRSDAEY